MDRDAPPIGWDDLPALQARWVALVNADLAVLRRLTFEIGDVRVRFQRVPPAADAGDAGHGAARPSQSLGGAAPSRHQDAAHALAFGGENAGYSSGEEEFVKLCREAVFVVRGCTYCDDLITGSYLKS